MERILIKPTTWKVLDYKMRMQSDRKEEEQLWTRTVRVRENIGDSPKTKPTNMNTVQLVGAFLLLLVSLATVCVVGGQAQLAKKEAETLDDNTKLFANKNDYDRLYRLLYSNRENNEGVPISIFKKFNDYGHLRFGRADGGVNSNNNNDRFKYSDPDYGHMRFG